MLEFVVDDMAKTLMWWWCGSAGLMWCCCSVLGRLGAGVAVLAWRWCGSAGKRWRSNDELFCLRSLLWFPLLLLLAAFFTQIYSAVKTNWFGYCENCCGSWWLLGEAWSGLWWGLRALRLVYAGGFVGVDGCRCWCRVGCCDMDANFALMWTRMLTWEVVN